MINPFMTGKASQDKLETAILFDKAIITDIGNSIAFTDGSRIFVNLPKKLAEILPAYNDEMLEWILWHEQGHIDLRHHERFFKYLRELDVVEGERVHFNVSPDEVNIIMDILVHDREAPMFPELVKTAENNCAQFRNRNSLMYTFKTFTLEEMLTEYSEYKKSKEEDSDTSPSSEESEQSGENKQSNKQLKESKQSKEESKQDDTSSEEESKQSDTSSEKESKQSEEESKQDDTSDTSSGETQPDNDNENSDTQNESGTSEHETTAKVEEGTNKPDEHDKTDWSKLKKIDSKEFVERQVANGIVNEINRVKNIKLKMGRLTQRLNGLVTTKRDRTYRLPSMLQTNDGCLFKGRTPGRTELYLIFDASGSMSDQMNIFKEIIEKSIPQAMRCPCEWFAGYSHNNPVKPYKTVEYDSYYKATFKDFMPIRASGGYCDDGDRTIELCYLAEQKGFTPIGVTDGGGKISWSTDMLKQLKRTVLVGQNSYWLDRCKEINPHIQYLDMDI